MTSSSYDGTVSNSQVFNLNNGGMLIVNDGDAPILPITDVGFTMAWWASTSALVNVVDAAPVMYFLAARSASSMVFFVVASNASSLTWGVGKGGSKTTTGVPMIIVPSMTMTVDATPSKALFMAVRQNGNGTVTMFTGTSSVTSNKKLDLTSGSYAPWGFAGLGIVRAAFPASVAMYDVQVYGFALPDIAMNSLAKGTVCAGGVPPTPPPHPPMPPSPPISPSPPPPPPYTKPASPMLYMCSPDASQLHVWNFGVPPQLDEFGSVVFTDVVDSLSASLRTDGTSISQRDGLYTGIGTKLANGVTLGGPAISNGGKDIQIEEFTMPVSFSIAMVVRIHADGNAPSFTNSAIGQSSMLLLNDPFNADPSKTVSLVMKLTYDSCGTYVACPISGWAFTIGTNTQYIQAVTVKPIASDSWTSLVITMNQGTMNMFTDGIQTLTNTYTYKTPTYKSASSPFIVKNNVLGDQGDSFDIGYLHIYNSTVTPSATKIQNTKCFSTK